MNNDVDAAFLQRISLVEDSLLDPILDHSSLATFNHTWSTLVNDLKSAIDADILLASTISAAHSLVEKVSNVIQAFLDLETLSEKLMSSLLVESSSILNSDPVSPVSDTCEKLPSASYIEPSYRWLLCNIHNPYPSVDVRDTIARETGSARKDIDSWFVDARKRIGWNALRKKSFSNKRVDIVAAATSFFLQDDSAHLVNATHGMDFVLIEKQAKDLYHNKFSQSDLASKLDVAVKDLTPEMKAEAKEEERRRRQEMHASRTIAISSYPSPAQSPQRSPEPTPVTYEDEPDASGSQSISMTSRKRRRSPSADPSELHQTGRLNKRIRPDELLLSVSSYTTGLPSPALSIDEPLRSSSHPPCILPSVPSLTPVPSSSRKRRLSDSYGEGAPKRPCNLPVGPRVLAVSNPLPMSSALFDASAFDGWFKQNFTASASPAVDALEPFDLEFGDMSHVGPEACDATTAPFNPLETSFKFALNPHDSFFDQNFSSLDNACYMPDFSCLAEGFPSDPAFSLHEFSDLVAPSSQPDTIQPIPAIFTGPVSYFDWELSEYIDMLPSANPTEYDNTVLSPLSFNAEYLAPPLQQAERAEKERKLFEMKEAARRLEEELAASL